MPALVATKVPLKVGVLKGCGRSHVSLVDGLLVGNQRSDVRGAEAALAPDTFVGAAPGTRPERHSTTWRPHFGAGYIANPSRAEHSPIRVVTAVAYGRAHKG
jgi:hypothetical protein